MTPLKIYYKLRYLYSKACPYHCGSVRYSAYPFLYCDNSASDKGKNVKKATYKVLGARTITEESSRRGTFTG
jgi:hypothetical protein